MRRILSVFLLSVLLAVAPAAAQAGRVTALPEFEIHKLLSLVSDAWSALHGLMGRALTAEKSETGPATGTGPTDGGTTQNGGSTSGSGTDPNGPGIDPNG
jgi:hypothetical protein